MKSNRSKISLLVSLCIHFVLVLSLSPFIVRHLNEFENPLALEFFKVESPERIKRRTKLEHKTIKPKIRTDSGSPSISRAAPKYAPEMNPPRAPIYDDLAPEIVTFAEIPHTNTSSLPNASFGKDVDAAGPVVIPEFQGAGGTSRGVGRGGSGSGKGGGMGKRLAGLSNTDDLPSIGYNEGDMGLGIFNTDVMPGHGLVGKVYISDTPIHRLPNFKRMTPVYSFTTANLDVSARHYTEGFPTPKKQEVLENFAIHFHGKLAVDTPGVYMFEMLSDDGSKLYINGKLVVDNDGTHGPSSRRSSIRLNAGFHPVEIQYFQGPRFQIALQWFYKPPNRPRQIVPAEVIFHPGKPEVPDALKSLKQKINK